jgi:ATP-binding cassette subfamily B (MDR/TAP) protein 1
MFLKAVSTAVAAFAVAFSQNWKLTGVALAILPVTFLVFGITIPLQAKIEKKKLELEENAANIAEESIVNNRSIVAFSAQEKMLSKYRYFVYGVRSTGLKGAAIIGAQLATTLSIGVVTYAVCYVYGTTLYEDAEVEQPGSIFAVFGCILLAMSSVNSIALQLSKLARSTSASNAMFEMLRKRPKIDALSGTGLSSINGDIRFQAVDFSYATRELVTVLDRVTFELEQTKTTALVGFSGSGKSTVVNLLERFYDPQGGRITVGGIDLRDLNLREWRASIGLVLQQPMVFKASVFENVAYGLTGTKWETSDENTKRQLVQKACKEVDAHKFISRLPLEYDTILGENGASLSGGQRQLLAIAQSIVADPKLLILDEATSALDLRSENVVQASLGRICKGRTTLVIAHRLSTIQSADKIIVMKSGSVIEQGTHKDLLNNGGMYKELVETQNWAREDFDPRHWTWRLRYSKELQEALRFSGKFNDISSIYTPSQSSFDLLSIGEKGQPMTARMFASTLDSLRARWPLYILAFLGTVGCGK